MFIGKCSLQSMFSKEIGIYGRINSYLCNQLGNALFCVTSGIFAERAQRDPAKSHELHKIAFPKVLHTRTKKKFLQTLNEVMNFINNKLLLC
jgi:hypothetical protein